MHSPLATPSATRKVLERHGITLKKSLGQNFLVDDAIVGKILALADVGPDDVILEVGPGIGTLTYALCMKAAHVISVERDPALPAVLADTLSEFGGRFTLVEKDALDLAAGDVSAAGALPGKFVANLPYAVAATVVLDYFERFCGMESATVMVQREVAERMMAAPGSKNYGAYTVKLSMYAQPVGSFSVAPTCFMPLPHVESTVLRLDRVRPDCGGVAGDVVKAACMMADAAFFARRKTVANSCRQYFASRNAGVASRIPEVLELAGIDPGVRGETLSKSDYVELGRALISTTKEGQ